MKLIVDGDLLRIPEAAQRLGLKPSTLRAWLLRQRIGCCRIGRAVRIPPSEIERVIKESYVPARDCRETQDSQASI